MIVFLFPRDKEIIAASSVEFSVLVGYFQITGTFHPDQMIYQGKTEL